MPGLGAFIFGAARVFCRSLRRRFVYERSISAPVKSCLPRGQLLWRKTVCGVSLLTSDQPLADAQHNSGFP